MVCFIDDDVICENYSVTEEIFLLMDQNTDNATNSNKNSIVQRNFNNVSTSIPAVKSGVVLDLHANPEATGSRFENPLWYYYHDYLIIIIVVNFVYFTITSIIIFVT